jgi:DNA polymerase III alpha subunit
VAEREERPAGRLAHPDDRPDLPRGTPQRLNPADYDVGFHRDGRPWRLSCLTYCERLLRLAAACGLATVLTTNAHYAGKNDRALHLVCRAAGRDEPLSGYPKPVAGARCLTSRAELERLAAPVLELVDPDDRRAPEPIDYSVLHKYCNAIDIASILRGGWGDGVNDDAVPGDAAAGGEGAADAGGAMGTGPLTTTWAIAQRCNVDLELGTFHFPQVDIPDGETAYSLLAKRCFRGIARQYKPVPPRAVELLEKELRMIQQMGFAHYFLVVHDIVRWARSRGIACSGRGSAGNSIVCHALDITASEPIRHNLLFERFLNPNRREMPDIDVDFCSSRRDEVIDHIYKTFGNENVAVVANVNTMSPRSAVRIVAEALGFAPTEINALAANVPHHGDAGRIREYLSGGWPELRDSLLQDGARYRRFLDLVERLDSFPMHLGTHLGGFVIADQAITYYAPLQWAAKGVVVTQFNKDDVAALGLVKMDILGLRTHSAVSECVHLIRQRTGRRIRPYELPPDDPAAYEIISNGGSIGLFQLESAGQRNLASRLQERDFDDVIAAIALYRPGPLEAEMIGPFIDRRWGLEPVSLPHPAMAEAVADTYGVILYQEQVLRIAQSVAGFDLADADSLRRAMTRDRSRGEMAKIGETFVARAVARGVPSHAAREVFRQLEGFAAYGFNKSHSVCFAVISYATAWLKAHYPAEFLCAVLNNQPMGFYTPRVVLNDARRFGLEVRPLDVNLSGRGFTVEDAEPPTVWGTAGAPGDPAATHTCGASTSYDPFAQAWTAKHGWGLTEADLAELSAEQEGVGPGGALAHASAGYPSFVYTLCPHSPVSPGGACAPAAAAPGAALHPGDAPLPRAPRARGGVKPSACLAPSCGLAPDAGRALRVGFSYLKQMGERSLGRIEEERRHGPFTSFEDFYLRTRIDYPVAENLIRVGAFDGLEPDRTELLWRLPLLHDRLEALSGSSGGRRGQLRAFSSPPSRAGLERRWSLEDKVRSELDLLGLTVSCHPLSLYEEELRRMGVRMSYELPGLGDEVPVTVAGVYERAQNPWMRSGKRTMFLTLEDAYGLYECVCFESKLAKIAPVVARASYFLVQGRLQNNHKRGLAIVAEEVRDLEEVMRTTTELVTPSAVDPGKSSAGWSTTPKRVG